jgi:hypothetical protein
MESTVSMRVQNLTKKLLLRNFMHLKDPNAFNHNIENVTAHFIELLTE